MDVSILNMPSIENDEPISSAHNGMNGGALPVHFGRGKFTLFVQRKKIGQMLLLQRFDGSFSV